jgi:hypothetical protein
MLRAVSVTDEPGFVFDIDWCDPILIDWESTNQVHFCWGIEGPKTLLYGSECCLIDMLIGSEDGIMEWMHVMSPDLRIMEFSEPVHIRRDKGAPVFDVFVIEFDGPTPDVGDGIREYIAFFVAVGKKCIWLDFAVPGEIAWAIEGQMTTYYMTDEGFVRRIKFSLSPEQMLEWRKVNQRFGELMRTPKLLIPIEKITRRYRNSRFLERKFKREQIVVIKKSLRMLWMVGRVLILFALLSNFLVWLRHLVVK